MEQKTRAKIEPYTQKPTPNLQYLVGPKTFALATPRILQYYVIYNPSNYGQKTPQIPFGLPAGSYSSSLDDLKGDDPNGTWQLYIYDDVQSGGVGQLYGSWSLDLTFQ